jgi:ubiquitin-conjugating enzyme E2 J1
MTSKSPAVKRLLRELAELHRDPPLDFHAAPLEGNILEWHFTVRGPAEGGFKGGRYHGRLIFPPDYPFKPPNIAFLHPNGRFEVNKKICLSITGASSSRVCQWRWRFCCAVVQFLFGRQWG